MQRAVLDVHGLLWVMEVDDVARTVRAFPGVRAVALDAVHGRLVVRFDEHVTGLEALQRVVQECHYHCRGERSLGHRCPSPALGEPLPTHRPAPEVERYPPMDAEENENVWP